MSLDLHVPQAVTWQCRGCQQSWPCRPAKLRLLAEYDGAPTALMIYLTDMRSRAAFDLCGGVPAGRLANELDARFIGWVTR